MKLSDIWSQLEKESGKISERGILKRMLPINFRCSIFVGLQSPTLNRVFMIQVPKNSIPIKSLIPESKGFELLIQSTGEEPDTHTTCILSSIEKKYNDVFEVMVENIYEVLTSCKDERDGSVKFFDKILQWKLFFERNGVNGLSTESQRGLYGELLFFKNVLLEKANFIGDNFFAWTGPKNRQHDFQFGETSVEVKTSSSKQHQKIYISSEQQLDQSLVKNLFIYHVSLSVIENSVDTLPKIIDEIRLALKDKLTTKLFFEEALLVRGYLDKQAWIYENVGYSIREINVFHVVEGFPKIIGKDLPTGVGDVSYTISVAECKNFSIPIDSLINHIGVKDERK